MIWLWPLVVVCVALFVVLALLRRYGVEEGSHREECSSLSHDIPHHHSDHRTERVPADDRDAKLEVAAQAYKIKPWLAKLIVISPIALPLVFGFALLFPTTSYIQSIAYWIERGENHPVETLSFIFDSLAGISGLALARRIMKRGYGLLVVGFYVLFSIGLLFVAGEEVAWGQWILGPDVLPTLSWAQEMNEQGENTLHNVTVLQYTDVFFVMAIGLVGLMGVAASFSQRFRKIGAPPLLLPWFLVIVALSVMEIGLEFAEMMVGIAGLLYIWLNARMLLLR